MTDKLERALRITEDRVRREGVVSLTRLNLYVKGMRWLRLALRSLEVDGRIERILRETKGREYVRIGSFLEPPVDEANLAKILSLIHSRKAVSRSVIAHRTRFGADKLEHCLNYLLLHKIIAERPTKREYWKWVGEDGMIEVRDGGFSGAPSEA